MTLVPASMAPYLDMQLADLVAAARVVDAVLEAAVHARERVVFTVPPFEISIDHFKSGSPRRGG